MNGLEKKNTYASICEKKKEKKEKKKKKKKVYFVLFSNTVVDNDSA